ncbi:DUF317 domain-containing protein [Kitasatospora sp. NPDC101155]|uniref:DUF317 domain-containing protein n=1 Tax=Kitasatospora sp. NPDC101155 TaxID=3364097 RepID=UPI00380CDDAA
MSAFPLVYVRPLYLAGPGDPFTVTFPLDTAPGWSRTETADVLRYTSPCGRATVTHEPAAGQGSWTVREYTAPGGELLWAARFGPGTPAEITAAFTTPLIDGLRSNHHDYLEGGPRYKPGSPASLLAERGWWPNPNSPKGFHDQIAPDGRAYYRHRVGYQPPEAELEGQAAPSWSMIAGSPHHPLWQADFTIGVPFYLLSNAAIALAVHPAKRLRTEIPPANRAHVATARATPTDFSLHPGPPPAPAGAPNSTGAVGPRRR